MPLSALASYFIVTSMPCPRRASETRTVPKVAAYRTSNVEEPVRPLLEVSACVSHLGVSPKLCWCLAERGDGALPIRGTRVYAPADSSTCGRPQRSPTGPLPARRVTDTGLAGRVAFGSRCVPGRLALHSRSCKMCIRMLKRESPLQALERRAWLQFMRGPGRERCCEKGKNHGKASVEAMWKHKERDRTPLSLNDSGNTSDQRDRRDEGNCKAIARVPVKAWADISRGA